MNPQRLAELQRQRDLVREHLAWLEREIAREHGGTPQPVAPAAVAAPHHATPAPPRIEPDLPQPDPLAAAASARRGCLLLFLGTLAFLVLGLTAIYFLRYRDRPLLFAPSTSLSR